LHNPDDSTSINSNIVWSICEDKTGNFWVGTDNGLNLFDRQNESFEQIYYQDSTYSQPVYEYILSLKAKGKTISSILQVGNNVDLTKIFTIKRKTIVLTIIMYEAGYDDGWLESANGDVIAGQENNNIVSAGGHRNNRIQILADTLNIGEYRLRYVSDGGWSYNSWRETPPDHPEFWGIQVIELGEEQRSIGEILDDKKSTLLNYYVGAIIEDQLTGNLYAGISNKISILDKEKRLLREKYNIAGLKYELGEIRSFHQARDRNIWIGHSMGMSKFNPQQNRIKLYQTVSSDTYNPENNFTNLIEDSNGLIWGNTIITNNYVYDINGLICFDPQNDLFQNYKHDPNNSNSISSNTLWTIYKDRSGIIWVGTGWAGLNKWDRNKYKFKRFSHNPDNPDSKHFNLHSYIVEDSEGIIWFGSDNGLNSYNRISNEFQNYMYDTKDKNNRVYTIYKDDSGIIWFGTPTRGLGKFNLVNGSFHFYSNDPNNSESISHNEVSFILPDENDVLWIGTWGGLNRFDKKTGRFTRYTHDPNNSQSLSQNLVAIIYKDRRGKLWIGTNTGGLNSFDRTNESFQSFDLEGGSSVMFIYEDRKGNFWIGTYQGGIHLFDRDKGISIYNITEKDGLANNQPFSIIEDDSGNLWIGTNNGLSRFDPQTRSIKNYFIDGFIATDFGLISAIKTSTGEMVFGTSEGFMIFHPDSIKDDPTPPKVVISNVSLFNRPGEILTFDGFISEMDEVELLYDENDLRFDYVGLHFGEPEKNQYKYMLENFDNDWVDAGTQRNATYTNLDAGDYVFRVTACNRDGVWNEEGASLRIIIPPPFWARWWAYLIYAIILLSIIYYSWKMQLKRISIKHDYEMSKLEAEKLQEVDGMKSRFFANISHEFRTPLTLIFGPAQDVLEKTEDPAIKKSVGIIKRNATRLYGLVNQLLDLSKL
ncbi:MAG: two-component regulator propeller domain-containing protein, partial [Ignavibacteriaceae bacterium]